MKTIVLDLSPLEGSDQAPGVAPYYENQMSDLLAAEALAICREWSEPLSSDSPLPGLIKGAVADVLGMFDGKRVNIPQLFLTPGGSWNGDPVVHHGTVWPAVAFGGDLLAAFSHCEKKGLDKNELFVQHCAKVQAALTAKKG